MTLKFRSDPRRENHKQSNEMNGHGRLGVYAVCASVFSSVSEALCRLIANRRERNLPDENPLVSSSPLVSNMWNWFIAQRVTRFNAIGKTGRNGENNMDGVKDDTAGRRRRAG